MKTTLGLCALALFSSVAVACTSATEEATEVSVANPFDTPVQYETGDGTLIDVVPSQDIAKRQALRKSYS